VINTTRRKILGIVAGAALVVAGAPAAQASPSHANEVAGAINATSPQSELLVPTADGSRLTVQIDAGTVEIPTSSAGSVQVSAAVPDAPGLSLGLPVLEGARDAEIADDGTVVYRSKAEVSLAVQADSFGFRVLTVLHSDRAQDDFRYNVALPEGATLESDAESGGAWILDGSGEKYAFLAPAWATDANGVDVPTWYSIEGDDLVQYVDHSAGDYSYPIVADPNWLYWVATGVMCAAEIAGLAFAAAKVVQAFAKAEKTIKAAKAMADAYKALGGSMSKVMNVVKTYIKNKKNLTTAQINALGKFSSSVFKTLFNAIGLGSCYDLVKKATS
jgi:hypothetical protein